MDPVGILGIYFWPLNEITGIVSFDPRLNVNGENFTNKKIRFAFLKISPERNF